VPKSNSIAVRRARIIIILSTASLRKNIFRRTTRRDIAYDYPLYTVPVEIVALSSCRVERHSRSPQTVRFRSNQSLSRAIGSISTWPVKDVSFLIKHETFTIQSAYKILILSDVKLLAVSWLGLIWIIVISILLLYGSTYFIGLVFLAIPRDRPCTFVLSTLF
jgi:hypothetical protein